MLIEHSVKDSARMVTLPEGTMIRIWLQEAYRFITIRVVNNGTSVMVEHFHAPGGASYAAGLKLEPNTSNSIVIK